MGLQSYGIISLQGSVTRPIIGLDMRAYEHILVSYRRATLEASRCWYSCEVPQRSRHNATASCAPVQPLPEVLSELSRLSRRLLRLSQAAMRAGSSRLA